jgi:Arc/MetJ-type ribon-helix-helix transcriptional regulator
MKQKIKWSVPVTRDLDMKVEKAVKDGRYVSKSELVRAGVRRLLEK